VVGGFRILSRRYSGNAVPWADTLFLVTELTFVRSATGTGLISFLSARDGWSPSESVANRFHSRYSNIDPG